MRTRLGDLLDKMVDGFTPSPSPQDEINAQVADMEKRLSDMIDAKLKNITNSQASGDAVDTEPPVDHNNLIATNDTGDEPNDSTNENINE